MEINEFQLIVICQEIYEVAVLAVVKMRSRLALIMKSSRMKMLIIQERRGIDDIKIFQTINAYLHAMNDRSIWSILLGVILTRFLEFSFGGACCQGPLFLQNCQRGGQRRFSLIVLSYQFTNIVTLYSLFLRSGRYDCKGAARR